MRRAVAATLAATVLGWPAGPAFGDLAVTTYGDTVVAGEACGWDFVRTNYLSGETHDEWAGEFHGGPFSAVDLAGDQPTVTLTCSLLFGHDTTHEDTPVTSRSEPGAVVAVVPPTPVTATDPAGTRRIAVCTKVTLAYAGGATADLYLDDWTGEFSTDPGVPCGPPPCLHSGCDLESNVQRLVADHVDPPLCEQLTGVPDQPGVVETGPDGDLYVLGEWVWDCPPDGS